MAQLRVAVSQDFRLRTQGRQGNLYVLQFHRPHLGQRTTIHSNFVAGVEARALETILVDLVGQNLATGVFKTKLREEVRDSGKQAHACDLVMLGLFEERIYQNAASALTFMFRVNGDGPDLGQMSSVEVQSAAGDDFVPVLDHNKVTNIF